MARPNYLRVTAALPPRYHRRPPRWVHRRSLLFRWIPFQKTMRSSVKVCRASVPLSRRTAGYRGGTAEVSRR